MKINVFKEVGKSVWQITTINVFLIFGMILNLSAQPVTQAINLKADQITLREAIRAIEKQSDKKFVYNAEMIDGLVVENLEIANKPLNEALDILLRPYDLGYSLFKDKIVIKEESVSLDVNTSLQINRPRSPAAGEVPEQTEVCIAGIVIDGAEKPVPHASVQVLGSNQAAMSGNNGRFSLGSVGANDQISFSCLGFEPIEIKAGALAEIKPDGGQLTVDNATIRRVSPCNYVIVLIESTTVMDEVEVNTGMFRRNRESFTGNTKTLSGEALRTASRKNLVESLAILDPSFGIIRNNNLGSSPHQLPNIEFRGKTSVPSLQGDKSYQQQLQLQYEQDPNQPLFVLDGFETDLRTIIDLDINRIASVTILKDAASTAMYGSKASNGVIVVETVKPSAGALLVNYNMTGTYDFADLRGYNIMNARELLEFQELAGVFLSSSLDDQQRLNNRRNNVMRGIDALWQNVPLRNAFSQNHTVNITGGSEYLTIGFSLGMNNTAGVMKGDKRTNYSGQSQISYRRDKINVTNNFTVSSNIADATPFGSFSEVGRIPPYFSAVDAGGKINTNRYLIDQVLIGYLGALYLDRVSNPLYNSGLPYLNRNKTLNIANNLGVNWDVFPWLRISAGGQLSVSRGRGDFFLSAMHTSFDNAAPNEKGSYSLSQLNNDRFSGFLTFTYNKVLAEKHIVNINLRGDISHNKSESVNIRAVGFAPTASPLITRALSYAPDAKPGGSETITRSLNMIGSLNYSYDRRYNFDFTYSRSGTSRFGQNNPFNTYFSSGIGWVISNERFFNRDGWLNQLRLTANIGYTGNDAGAAYFSRNTYALLANAGRLGEGLSLAGIGSPFLKGQRTRSTSVNLYGMAARNKISFSLSAYEKLTNPLIITTPVPGSVGVSSQPENLGALRNRGLEVELNFHLIGTTNWDWTVGIKTPILQEARYEGFGNALDQLNTNAQNNDYLLRYRDGASPNDLWAVRSLGIDPTSGLDLYLDKNDNVTYKFDYGNEVELGSSLPVTQGTIPLSLRYKAFSLNIYARYELGAWKFNRALFDKVENLSKDQIRTMNHDRRALYERWKNPGDHASFQAVTEHTANLSSRFLQRENGIFFESINLNYDFTKVTANIRDRLGIRSLQFAVNLSNLFDFQLSNIPLERGLDYPFTRSVGFNLNIGF